MNLPGLVLLRASVFHRAAPSNYRPRSRFQEKTQTCTLDDALATATILLHWRNHWPDNLPPP